jgi:hypothetical protein
MPSAAKAWAAARRLAGSIAWASTARRVCRPVKVEGSLALRRSTWNQRWMPGGSWAKSAAVRSGRGLPCGAGGGPGMAGGKCTRSSSSAMARPVGAARACAAVGTVRAGGLPHDGGSGGCGGVFGGGASGGGAGGGAAGGGGVAVEYCGVLRSTSEYCGVLRSTSGGGGGGRRGGSAGMAAAGGMAAAACCGVAVGGGAGGGGGGVGGGGGGRRGDFTGVAGAGGMAAAAVCCGVAAGGVTGGGVGGRRVGGRRWVG